MQNFKNWELLSILFLVIPVNIYTIGDFIGAGISFPFFKFQISFAGTMLFSISQELSYVLNGTYHHNTAISILVWITAFVFLISTVIVILINNVKKDIRLKIASLLLTISTVGFLISIMFQFGPYFHCPVGIAIPIGIPLMFVIGGWMYMEGRKEEAGDEEKEVQGIAEESG